MQSKKKSRSLRPKVQEVKSFGSDDENDKEELTEKRKIDDQGDESDKEELPQKTSTESRDHDSENDEVAESLKRKRKRKRTGKASNATEDEGTSEAQDDAPAGSSSADVASNHYANDKTIYIEGLPYEATEEDVTQFFGSCGRISSIRLPKWHDSGRLRGYGHVEFESASSSQKALGLDGGMMKKRYIKVARPMTPRVFQAAAMVDKSAIVKPAGCKSVFVKNIPYDCTEEGVMEVMKVCGPITSVRLAMWGNTKQLKGFGYVDFKREDSAEIAVKKSGVLNIKGRPLAIDFETGAPKMSFRTADGKSWSKTATGKKH